MSSVHKKKEQKDAFDNTPLFCLKFIKIYTKLDMDQKNKKIPSYFKYFEEYTY